MDYSQNLKRQKIDEGDTKEVQSTAEVTPKDTSQQIHNTKLANLKHAQICHDTAKLQAEAIFHRNAVLAVS